MKTCRACNKVKPTEGFYKNRRVCKSCCVEACRKYQKENPERFKQYQSKYYRNNKTKRNKTTKEWQENNPDRAKDYAAGYYKENKRRLKPIREAWNKRNQHKLAARTRKYRTRKANSCPAWLTEDQLQEIQNFYWLAKDLRAVTGEEYHVDHIVPLQGKNVCGLHVPWNLQLLPKDLNLKKSNLYED